MYQNKEDMSVNGKFCLSCNTYFVPKTLWKNKGNGYGHWYVSESNFCSFSCKNKTIGARKDVKNKKRAASIQMWQEDSKEERIAKIKASLNTSEIKNKISRNTKEGLIKSGYTQKRRSDDRRKDWAKLDTFQRAERVSKAVSRVDQHKKGKNIKKTWEDPNIRQKRIAGLVSVSNTEDGKRRLNAAAVSFWKSDNAHKTLYTSKKRNNSFHISKPEKEVYALLCSKYGHNEVERQYRDEERYPFVCDFYIKAQDMFLECNFSWTHGNAPYDTNNTEHRKRLTVWRQKAKETNFKGEKKKYYLNAIDTWTRRDPLKVSLAKKNGVNLKIFYKKKDIENWISEE